MTTLNSRFLSGEDGIVASYCSQIARYSPNETWVDVRATFQGKRSVIGVLADLFLPPCLLELFAIGLLFPALFAPATIIPFLIIPITIYLLVISKTSGKRRWEKSEASVQRGFLFLRISGKHITDLKPKNWELLNDVALLIKSRFKDVKLTFGDSKDASTISDALSQ